MSLGRGGLRKLGFAAAVLLSASEVGALEFPGGVVGAIPDNNPAGCDVAFVVSGIASPLADVRVPMTLQHIFVGDLEAELISLGGTARRVIFGRSGRNAGGANGDLNGIYVFSDRGSDWWAMVAAAAGGVIPGGEFRASTAGATASSLQAGGCTAPVTFAFGTLAPADINGTWTLHVADREGSDTGSITAASLRLIPTSDAIFGNGFDGIVRGKCVHAQFDYTGSNRTSYVVVRNTGGGQGGATIC